MREPIHQENKIIRVSQVGKEFTIKINALLDWMQDAAYTHSNKLDIFSTDRLLSRSMSWVLMRKFTRVNRLPALGQRIHLTTYPSGINRYYAFRDFKLTDEQGDVLVLATTSWAVFDLDKRRIIKTPSDFIEGFSPPGPPALNFPGSRIEALKQPEFEAWIQVRSNDLDLNGHVNNSCLADWSFSCLPVDLRQNFHLKELDIAFRGECTLDFQTVHSSAAYMNIKDSVGQKYILHALKNREQTREFARAVSLWQKAFQSSNTV